MPGDPIPRFTLPGVANPRFTFDSAAGRYLVAAFVPPAEAEAARALLEQRPETFDDHRASGFVIVVGEDAERDGRRDTIPGIRFLFDAGAEVALQYGVGAAGRWVLIDPSLQVMAMVNGDHAAPLLDQIASLPAPAVHGGFEALAPVLVTPRIFEHDFCQALIAVYRREGGVPSGVMRQVGDRTRLVMSEDFKKRSDVIVPEGELRKGIVERLSRRLVPQVERAFAFRPTRIERYLVACYDSGTGGFFRPHRDNTTVATRHRRFAVSINLNGDYDGGDLRFPEFGPRTYRPPPGGACVFSCSILHEATAVTRGERFAFLPFMHDEAAETLRVQNQAALAL